MLCAVATTRLEGVPSRMHLALLAGAGAHLAVVAGWMIATPPPATASGRLPGGGTVAVALLPVYAAVALVTGAAAYLLWRRNRHGTLGAAMVGPSLLLLAAGLVNAFGAGLLIRLADLLGSPRTQGSGVGAGEPASRILYADWVGDVAVVTVFALFVLGGAGLLAWLRAGPGPSCEELAVRYADRGGLDCHNEDDRHWAGRVGRAQAVALLTDRAATVLGAVTLVVVVAVAGAVLTSDDATGLGLGSWADALAAPASVVLGVIPVLAMLAISRMYRSRAVRRLVGILWDVATFWPRWFHPWSPPSYGERAVPQLGRRIEALARAGGVVVSAHSQGSVLTAATLALTAPVVAERISVLTHGSPLTRLYARFFPEYLSPGLYTVIARRTAGWVNLWRPTDFIGGPVSAGGVVDQEVFDPPSSQPELPGEPRPLPLRHNDYERTEEYRAAAAQLAAAVGSA